MMIVSVRPHWTAGRLYLLEMQEQNSPPHSSQQHCHGALERLAGDQESYDCEHIARTGVDTDTAQNKRWGRVKTRSSD